MIYIVCFVLIWILWLLFADKKRWRELFSVSIFASLLGALTDTIMEYYKLWEYPNSHPLLPLLIDDLGVYIVIPYLFIQWLPKEKSFSRMFWYLFLWTAISLGLEWVHIATGYMRYQKWWNIGISYISDWILFIVFIVYYKSFRLERLNGD